MFFLSDMLNKKIHLPKAEEVAAGPRQADPDRLRTTSSPTAR